VSLHIETIATGMVNCYLVKTGTGFVLIDSGMPFWRGRLKKALNGAGCHPEDLKLVVITHADTDHTGNAAWLHEKYGAPVAVHREEAGAVETGRILLSRKSRPGLVFRAAVNLGSLLIFRRFRPDVLVTGGEDLSEYGLEGSIVHIPGHSRGSIGVLTKDGDFFCGDLLTGGPHPVKNSLVDDAAEMDASIEKLKTLDIKIVYPGHGRPFPLDLFFKDGSL
jgi:hydroxyacylglutathione hydrolase